MASSLIHDFVRAACEAWYLAKCSSLSRYDLETFTKAAMVVAQSDNEPIEDIPIQVVGLSQVQDVLTGALLLSTRPGSAPNQSVDQRFSTHLLDRGLSPWQGQGLSSSMALAIECGADQFIARALELPNAPLPREFLLARTSRGIEVLEALASSHYGAPALAKIIPSAQPLDQAVVLRALKSAAPACVPLLASLARPLSATHTKAIQQAWTRQLGKKKFSQDELASMMESLSSAGGDHAPVADPQTIARNAKITKLVTVPWVNTGAPKFTMNNAAGLPKETLAAHTDIAAGPLSGHWTGWSAASMHLLKNCGHRGVYPYAFDSLVNRLADLNPGCLSGSLGVEWRPGIQVDGIIWLAIHGREDRGDHYREFMTRLYSAAGVEDPPQWHAASLDHARRFTVEVMARRSTPQAGQALSHAWSRALRSDPARQQAQQWSVAEKIELIKALTFNYFTVNSFFGVHRNACISAFESMFPDIKQRALRERPLDPLDPELPETLAYLFLGVSSSIVNKVRMNDVIPIQDQHLRMIAQRQNRVVEAILDTTPGTFPKNVVELMETWAKACVDNADQDDAHEKQVLAWCRASRLANYTISSSRPITPGRVF